MAVVRRAGWTIDKETGEHVFRVQVDYSGDDMPDFEISVIWKQTPVEIRVLDK